VEHGQLVGESAITPNGSGYRGGIMLGDTSGR
jgi:hypothetical protein